jgi:hypothetical protein
MIHSQFPPLPTDEELKRAVRIDPDTLIDPAILNRSFLSDAPRHLSADEPRPTLASHVGKALRDGWGLAVVFVLCAVAPAYLIGMLG